MTFFEASAWVIPVIIAVTFHEAAHGFVALMFGDDTAWRLGRVSFNPLKHIDPFGTVLLPGMLLLLRSPFLFGYAKPVPVNFKALRNPRRDMIWVAAAGPGMNIALATAAALAFHLVLYLPATSAQWVAQNLQHAVVINVWLAVFNMLPLPPLDGSKVVAPFLPESLRRPYLRFGRYGMTVLLLLVFVAPILAAQARIRFDIFGWLVLGPAETLTRALLSVFGQG